MSKQDPLLLKHRRILVTQLGNNHPHDIPQVHVQIHKVSTLWQRLIDIQPCTATLIANFWMTRMGVEGVSTTGCFNRLCGGLVIGGRDNITPKRRQYVPGISI